jgi:hypothetical protein
LLRPPMPRVTHAVVAASTVADRSGPGPSRTRPRVSLRQGITRTR